MPRLRRVVPCGAALAALALPARAHEPEAGLAGFQTGFLHPLSNAPQILALVAVVLLCGLALRGRHVRAAGAFAASFLVGLAMGRSVLGYDAQDLALLAAAAAGGGVAALAPRAASAAWAITALAGLLMGMASWPEPGPLPALAVTCAGSVVATGLAVLYGAAGVGAVRGRGAPEWVGIGLRVAAAWVAAVSALLLALGAAG